MELKLKEARETCWVKEADLALEFLSMVLL